MDKYTVFLPRHMIKILGARAFDKDAKACLISITEPDDTEVELIEPWVDVLRVAFWDVVTPVIDIRSANLPTFRPMQEDVAKAMAAFIKKHIDEHIIVHCRAGKSRSAAVVRLLLDLGWKKHPTVFALYGMEGYNVHVYNTLKRQFPELLPEGAV